MRYLILIAGLAAAAAGYFFYWSSLAATFQSQAQRAIAEQQALGRAITHGEITVSGFPGMVQLDFPAAAIAGADDGGPWSLRTEHLQLMAKPWQPRHLIATLGHRQEWNWGKDGAPQRGAAQSDKALASLVIDSDGKWQRLSTEFNNLAVEGPQGWSEFKRLEAHARRDEALAPNDIQVAGKFEDLVLPLAAMAPNPLGRKIASGQMVATLKGPFSAGPGFAPALSQWRDQGGVMEIARLFVVWDRIQIQAEGTVTLDKEMRPLGALSAKIWGLEALLELLVATETIRERDSGLLGAALSVMSRQSDDGRAFVEVAVTLQQGRLFLGPFAILQLEPVLTPINAASSPAPPPLP